MRDSLRSFPIFFCLLFISKAAFAQTTYDWTGAVSTDWGTPGNWESTTGGVTTNPALTCPGSADQAQIGVLPMTNTSNWPVVSTATSVGSIVWGTENYLNVYLTVNATFTVNGSINNTSAVPGNGASSAYTFNISGTGTMNVAGSLNIGYDDGFSTSNPGNNNSFAFNSSLNNLNIQGSTYLNVFQGDTKHRGFVPALNITGGTFTTTSIQSVLTNSTTANSLLTAGLTVGNSSGTPAATLQLTGASSLPSFSPYITNTITFNNPGATVEYSGASQTVYTDNAVANLSNTISYYSIKFSGTGVKTALSGNLNVAGDFTNTMANDACNCNSVSLSAPTVNFNGTTQNLYGGGGNGTTFYTVNFSNSGTKTMQSGVFNLASTGVLTMSGSSTTLAAGSGIFTLLSDASSTATVAAIPSGCSITGTVNAQRYISGTRGWRFLSSPVNTGTTDASGNTICSIKYLKNALYISGQTGTTGGFDWAGNPSIFLYREDNTPNYGTFTNTNFRGIGGLTTDPSYPVVLESGSYSIPQANGYQVFIRGDRNTPGTSQAAQKNTAYTFSSVTVSASGSVNQGQITFRSWYTPTKSSLSYLNLSSTLKGYNLVGNPYASSINWDLYNTSSSTSGIYVSGVSKTIYTYNFINKNYGVYTAGTGGAGTNGGSNVIASGQAFFVVATSATSTLTFNESAKTTSSFSGMNKLLSTEPLEQTIIPSLRLQMKKDSINTDETLVIFNSNARGTYDIDEDGAYMTGNGLVHLATFSSDSVALAINQMPLTKETKPIYLKTEGNSSGAYQLVTEEIKAVPRIYNIWLKDAFTGDSVNMRKLSTYSFSIDKNNAATFGDKRFSVVFRQDTASAYHLLNFTASKITGTRTVQTEWETVYEENYTNFTVERSTDGGKTFLAIGGLRGTGAGNYSLIDKTPVIGSNLYRLKQEDINSIVKYSDIIMVSYVNMDKNKIQTYPNPATSMLNVYVEPDNNNPIYQVSITSSAGTVVHQETSAQSQWQTNVSSLSPGTYFVQIVNKKDNSIVGKTKFVKM